MGTCILTQETACGVELGHLKTEQLVEELTPIETLTFISESREVAAPQCSETYRGPLAFSEPETLAMKDYILGKRAANVSWDAYITLHSYSQLWMTPYGYTTQEPENYAEMKNISDEAVAVLTNHFNTRYDTGNSGAVLCKQKCKT